MHRSLYPHACRDFSYPTGKPTVISKGQYESGFIQLDQIFGPITASFYPPNDTLFPVLPVKLHSRLMFPLCMNCARKLNPDRCKCSPEQRMITGTWTHVEVMRALQTGYRLAHFHVALHYDENNRSPGGVNGLFYSYMQQFYKIKKCNSGWPDWCKTDEQKQVYVDSLSSELETCITPNSISDNTSLKYLAKLLLNSLSIPFFPPFIDTASLHQIL